MKKWFSPSCYVVFQWSASVILYYILLHLIYVIDVQLLKMKQYSSEFPSFLYLCLRSFSVYYKIVDPFRGKIPSLSGDQVFCLRSRSVMGSMSWGRGLRASDQWGMRRFKQAVLTQIGGILILNTYERLWKKVCLSSKKPSEWNPNEQVFGLLKKNLSLGI